MKYHVAPVNSYRFEKQVWYKAVVIVVKVNSIQVQFTGDGSTAILEANVLCNSRTFRYFDPDSNLTDIPDEADAPWEPTDDVMQVSTRAISYWVTGIPVYLHVTCILYVGIRD